MDASCSHNSDAGSNLEGLLVRSEGHICLLLSIGADEGVDSGDLNFVEVLASALDRGLLGAAVADEHEGVVLLNGFDRGFAGQRELDDAVGVEDDGVLDTESESNRGALLGLADGASEGGLGPDLDLVGLMLSFLNVACNFLSLQRKTRR
jgi:hypothetical protein